MRIVEKSISMVKGRQTILDPRVSAAYLCRVMAEKAVSLARGFIKTRKPIFIGTKTSVRAPSQLLCGKGVEIGAFCEIDCLSLEGLSIGSGSRIGSYSAVKVSGTLSDLGKRIVIGSNVGIGEFAHIGGAGGVSIGDDTIVGAYLSVHPENHIFSDTNMPIRDQGFTRSGIEIGRGCWIGAKVTILDGVKIGDGCVIAAGSVVRTSFPAHCVIGGVPARLLRTVSSTDKEC
jgi:acetyltransferase-like isoleucine patch superfamily enzyme